MKAALYQKSWPNRKIWFGLGAVLVGILSIIGVGCERNPAADERQSVVHVVEEVRKDWEKGDIRSFLELGDKEMRFFSLDGRNLNKREALNFLQPMFKRWWDRKLTIDSLEVFTDCNLALVRYHAVFSFLSTTGRTELEHLVSMVLRKRQNSDWKILQFHMSAKPP